MEEIDRHDFGILRSVLNATRKLRGKQLNEDKFSRVVDQLINTFDSLHSQDLNSSCLRMTRRVMRDRNFDRFCDQLLFLMAGPDTDDDNDEPEGSPREREIGTKQVEEDISRAADTLKDLRHHPPPPPRGRR